MNRTNESRGSFSSRLARTLAVLGVAVLAAACSKKPDPVEVVIALAETPGTLSDATILVDYSQASATPLISGGRPACASIQPHIDATFSDDGGGAMTIEASSSQGFTGPLDIAACRMVAESSSVAPEQIHARIRVSLLAAADPAGKKVDDRRLARSGSSRSSMGDGAGAPDSPVGRIDRDHSGTDGDGYRPAMPKGTKDARREAGLPPVATRPGRAVDPPPIDEAPPESVEELLARRGTDTTRKTASAVGSELDQKAAALKTDGKPGDPGTDVNDETDADETAFEYDVTLGVTSVSGDLGALQFDVRYTGGEGGWLGSGSTVVCTNNVPAALVTFNDRKGGWMSGALVDLTGFSTPGAIASCRFKGHDPVNGGTFAVTVIDASLTDSTPPDGRVDVAVTDVVRVN